MPFLIRSNLISFVLDLLFNMGLGLFCLFHFKVPEQHQGLALTLLAWLYVPRTIIFFGYRILIMLPMHAWLKNRQTTEEAVVKAATKSAYEASLKSNLFNSEISTRSTRVASNS